MSSFILALTFTQSNFLFSKSSGPGQHWFVIFRPSSDVIEVFDSLGSDAKSIKSKQLPFKAVYEFNETALQNPASSLCGQFCIYFIVNRLYELDSELNEVVNDIFVKNTEENEKAVRDFLKLL